jgi:hypothetical protein
LIRNHFLIERPFQLLNGRVPTTKGVGFFFGQHEREEARRFFQVWSARHRDRPVRQNRVRLPFLAGQIGVLWIGVCLM